MGAGDHTKAFFLPPMQLQRHDCSADGGCDATSSAATVSSSTCNMAVFRDALPTDLLVRVRKDVNRVLDSEYIPPPNPKSLTFGTYWWSASTRNTVSRNAIEEAIAVMRDSVLPGVLDVEAMAGAEWWLQDTDGQDPPKEFHTDCDVEVSADGAGTRRHPAMSSVFYLDAIGGGTVVAGQVKGDEGGLEPSLPLEMAVAFPHPNQLLVFAGDLFHAVLHPCQGFPPGADRRVLLVNWWPSRPSGPLDMPAPFCFHSTVPPQQTGHSPHHPPTPSPKPPLPLRSIQVREPFTSHLDEWAAQRLPAALRGSVEDGLPLFVRYRQQHDDESNAEVWRNHEWPNKLAAR